jgi:hypothetical protein
MRPWSGFQCRFNVGSRVGFEWKTVPIVKVAQVGTDRFFHVASDLSANGQHPFYLRLDAVSRRYLRLDAVSRRYLRLDAVSRRYLRLDAVSRRYLRLDAVSRRWFGGRGRHP